MNRANSFWLWRNGLKPHLTPKFNIRRGGCGAGFLALWSETNLALGKRRSSRNASNFHEWIGND
jgi:hypothetical protein